MTPWTAKAGEKSLRRPVPCSGLQTSAAHINQRV
jgi:hypothetical protein